MNDRRTGLLLALAILMVVALAVLGAFGGWFHDPTTPTASGRAAGQVQASNPIGSADGASLTERSVRIESTDASDATPDPDALGVGTNLLVVDESGTPLVGAEVFYRDPKFWWTKFSHEENERFARDKNRDLEVFLRQHGLATVSDARGRCFIPGVPNFVDVLGRRGDLYGAMMVHGIGAEERRLVLRPDSELVVQVTTSSGSPAADVQVLALVRRADGDEDRKPLGFTDRGGIFVVRHVQTLPGGESNRIVTLAASPVGSDVGHTKIDCDRLERRTIEIGLPPTGSWRLRLLARDGQPASVQYAVNRHLGLRSESGGATWARSLDRGAEVVFPHVLLDRQYQVLMRTLLPKSRTLAGPTAAEPNLVTDLVLAKQTTKLTGRAIDAEGKPLADCLMQNFLIHDGRHEAQMLKTDERGHFVSHFNELQGLSSAKFHLRIWPDPEDREQEVQAHVVVAPIDPTRNALGDVTFSKGQLIARGRIVRGDGQPFGESLPYVSFRELGPAGAGRSIIGEFSWLEPDGFEFYGLTDCSQVQVFNGHRMFFMEKNPVIAIGTTDLELTIHALGKLTAEFVLDPGTPWTELGMVVEPNFAPLNPRARTIADSVRSSDGRVVATWMLESGSYDLRVFDASGQALVHLEDVSVPHGTVADDRRLRGIPLRATAAELRVVDSSGALVEVEGGWVMPLNRSKRRNSYPLHQGVVSLPLVEPLQVTIMVPGYHRETQMLTIDGATVVLRPAGSTAVQVRFPELMPADLPRRLVLKPGPGHPLAGATTPGFAQIEGAADRGYFPRATATVITRAYSVVLDADGRCQVSPGFAGRYVAEVWIGSPSSFGMRWRGARQVLTIPSTIQWSPEDTAAIQLEVDAAALRKVLDELGAKGR